MSSNFYISTNDILNNKCYDSQAAVMLMGR